MGAFTGGVAWTQNDGGGTFQKLPLWGSDQALEPFAIAVHDMDGDLDLDVAAVGFHDEILWNLRRQLAWRRLPSLGKPLVLDVWGAAGTPWLLAWSSASASIPLAPFGTLRLDPAHLKPLAFGAFGPQAAATFATTLPASPALAGLTVHAQALCGAPLAFTNPEAIPLTTF